jgi:putative glycosyltransferase
MELSIVTTTYNESKHIKEFCERSVKACENIGVDEYEILVVDDGSDPKIFSLIEQGLENFEQVTLIKLSRNFGHHSALLRGVQESSGSLVYLVDSDLEESPEWIEPMRSNLFAKNLESVYAVQVRRRGSWLDKLSGWIFYKMVNQIFGISIQKNMMTARLMTRKFADALLSINEYSPNLSGMLASVGFSQEPILLEKPRLNESTYTFRRKLSIVFNLLASFSTRPLKIIFILGLNILGLAVMMIIWFSISWIRGNPPEGWTAMVTIILFFGFTSRKSLTKLGVGH